MLIHLFIMWKTVKKFHSVIFKKFQGNYTDKDGLTTRKEYELYVLDLDVKLERNFNAIGKILEEKGAWRTFY